MRLISNMAKKFRLRQGKATINRTYDDNILSVLDNNEQLKQYSKETGPILEKYKELEALEYKMLSERNADDRNELLNQMIEMAKENHLYFEYLRYKNYKFKKLFTLRRATIMLFGTLALYTYILFYPTNEIEPTKQESKKTFADVLV